MRTRSSGRVLFIGYEDVCYEKCLKSLGGRTLKTCTKCKVEKSFDQFYRRPGRPCGFMSRCKTCMQDAGKARMKKPEARDKDNKTRRAYYARKGRFAQAAYLQTEPARAMHRKHAEAYKNMNPEKKLAHAKVRWAIKSGNLERLPCEVCGNPRSQGHHDDYSKPIEVVWLCQRHHIERHKQLVSMHG